MKHCRTAQSVVVAPLSKDLPGQEGEALVGQGLVASLGGSGGERGAQPAAEVIVAERAFLGRQRFPVRGIHRSPPSSFPQSPASHRIKCLHRACSA